MTKRISYHIFNSINSESLLTIVLPFDYRKAVYGFYSNLWRDFKISIASSYKIDKRFVRVKLLTDRVSTNNRMLLVFPSGLRFYSPFDLNKIDFKIINLHLEALQLSRQEA